MNAIKAALAVGRSSNGMAGELILGGLEVAFLLAAPKQGRFSGRLPMRLRQHTFITAIAGIGKSFLTNDVFFQSATGAKYPLRGDRAKTGDIRVIDDDGETTWEAWRGGSTSTGRPIEPLILSGDFVVIGELGTVIGEGSKLDLRRARSMGTLAEEGRMTVKLNKLEEMDDDSWKEFVKKARDLPGFTVSYTPRGYSLKTNAVFVVLSTPLDEANAVKLHKAGFISRFDYIDVEMTREEQLEALRAFGGRAVADVDALRVKNQDIWNTPFCPIPYPPADLLDNYALAWLTRQADEISAASNTDPLSIANLRDAGMLARLMVASAIARIFETRSLGDRTPVGSITYTKADADFAIAYMTRHFNNRRIRSVEDEKSKLFDSIPDGAHKAMRETLEENYDDADDGLPTFGYVDVFVRVAKRAKLSEGTAKNYLSMFRKAGLITGGKYGDKSFRVTNESYITKRLGLERRATSIHYEEVSVDAP